MRARLHDLCFEAGYGQVGAHARAAVHAYVELGDQYGSGVADEMNRILVSLAAVRSLERALELARRTNQQDLAELTIERLLDHARMALQDGNAGPGVVLGFLGTLAEDRSDIPDLDDLLRSARTRYSDDLWHTRTTIEMQLKRSGQDAAARSRLHREIVQSLLDAAAREPVAMNAVIHLQDAAQFAQNFGLTDLSGEAISRLQRFSIEDLGLVRRAVGLSLPKELVEGFLEQFTAQETWQGAFRGLVAVDPPIGNVEQNRAQAAELPEIAPLSTLFPSTRLGPDGLPRFTSAGGDPAHLMVKVELQRLQLLGPIYIEALRRIGAKWHPIDEGALAVFLGQANHVSQPVAAALSRAVGRFFSDDYEGAAYLCVPKIERLARDLLLSMNAPVFRVAHGPVAGQYPGLGALLGMLLDRGLDESWARFIDTLLTRQDGLNFRNELLHGSIDEVSQGVAGLVMIAALYLALGVHLVQTSP
jgi:hypothetical protein